LRLQTEQIEGSTESIRPARRLPSGGESTPVVGPNTPFADESLERAAVVSERPAHR
jgi:hypothetical protein